MEAAKAAKEKVDEERDRREALTGLEQGGDVDGGTRESEEHEQE